jgi:outer membrane protein OmpA-like peptidoglycan-associated protein
MNKRAYGRAMFTLLGLGTADLATFNLWAMPAARTTLENTTALNAIRSADPPSAPSPGTPPQRTPRHPDAPSPLHPPAANVSPTDRSQPIEHKTTILFHRGTWWVGPAGRRALRSSLEHLTPARTIQVEGHADESGSTEINQRISARRASVVAALLVQAGVDPARIEQRAFGEARASGTGFDRRVELIIRGEP